MLWSHKKERNEKEKTKVDGNHRARKIYTTRVDVCLCLSMTIALCVLRAECDALNRQNEPQFRCKQTIHCVAWSCRSGCGCVTLWTLGARAVTEVKTQ